MPSQGSRCFHVSERTAQGCVQNYRRSGRFRRKAILEGIFRQDARLVAEVEMNAFHTAANLKAAANFSRHEQTVRNRLNAEIGEG